MTDSSLPAAFVCFATKPKRVAWRNQHHGNGKPRKEPVICRPLPASDMR